MDSSWHIVHQWPHTRQWTMFLIAPRALCAIWCTMLFPRYLSTKSCYSVCVEKATGFLLLVNSKIPVNTMKPQVKRPGNNTLDISEASTKKIYWSSLFHSAKPPNCKGCGSKHVGVCGVRWANRKILLSTEMALLTGYYRSSTEYLKALQD